MSTTPYTGPKISIKDIQLRSGVPITGAFIVDTLKVEPVEKEKRSVFWAEAQYPEIVDKLIAKLQAAKSATGKAEKVPAKPREKKPGKATVTTNGGAFAFNTGGTTAAAPAPAAGGFFGAGSTAAAAAPASDAGGASGFSFGGTTAAPAEAPAAAPAPAPFVF